MKRIWLIVVLFCGSLLFASTAKLKSVEIGSNRLILHFDRPWTPRNLHFFVLKGPYFRYVFDLKNVKLAKRDLASKLRYLPPLRAIRISQYRYNIVRLVIESSEPYAITHYSSGKKSYTIILPKGSVKAKVNSLFLGLNSQRHGKKNVRVSAHLMKNRPLKAHRRYVVIIDPGHGGQDSGALDPSRRYREKDAVLQIALRLRRHLRKMGFKVIMTRSSDYFIKLHQRTRFANLKHGDIFVSIHANAVGNLSRANIAHGIETYFLSPARSDRARRVAAKENSIAFVQHDADTMNSFLSTLTRSKIILSNKLALDVQRGILSTLRRRYSDIVDGGVRAAPFWVLVGAEMPAILIETGYITHPMEKRRLFDPLYQDTQALGIAKGIQRFLRNREREME